MDTAGLLQNVKEVDKDESKRNVVYTISSFPYIPKSLVYVQTTGS